MVGGDRKVASLTRPKQAKKPALAEVVARNRRSGLPGVCKGGSLARRLGGIEGDSGAGPPFSVAGRRRAGRGARMHLRRSTSQAGPERAPEQQETYPGKYRAGRPLQTASPLRRIPGYVADTVAGAGLDGLVQTKTKIYKTRILPMPTSVTKWR